MMISESRSCSWTRPSPLSASCPPPCSWCYLRTAPRLPEQSRDSKGISKLAADYLEQRRVQSRSPEPRHHHRQLPTSSLQLSVPVITARYNFHYPLKAVFTCFATFFFTGERERSRSPSDMMSAMSAETFTGNVTLGAVM